MLINMQNAFLIRITILLQFILTFYIICCMLCRCDIPVVIMGETGCGKTRLIRYMCDLARQERKLKNLFILKVCAVGRSKNSYSMNV